MNPIFALGTLLGTASAAPVDAESQDAVAPSTTPIRSRGRKFKMEIGFRARSMSIPKGLMDIVLENEQETGWPVENEPRPQITGYAGGIEFIVKGDEANGIFYVEYLKSTMDRGYWVGNNSTTISDGKYLVPSDNLGMVMLGADYNYEAHLLRLERTNHIFGLSLLVGGGLGVGIRTGKIDAWEGEVEKPAWMRYSEGEAPTNSSEYPPIVTPILDLTAAVRFNFGDRFSVRVEGGLHTLLFYGASAGLIF